MSRIRKCAACRYCRVRTAVKTSVVILAGAIVFISALAHDGMI